jgi:hypothetical protein
MREKMRSLLVGWLASAMLAAAVLALAGCATEPQQGRFNPALFPSQATEATFDGQVALLADPASPKLEVLGERLADAGPVHMPIGRIVHEASLKAFAEAFRGGARSIDRIGGEPGAPTPIVIVRVVNYVYRDRLQYLIPLLFPLTLQFYEKWQLDVQLVVEVRLLAEDGAMLWSGTFDSGVQIWEPLVDSPIPIPIESHTEGLLRQTHETAYRLMQRAARDVGEWLRKERLRERRL